MAEQSRGELRHYLSKSSSGPWNRIGDGFSSFGGNLNPQEETTTYINDKSSTVVTGYQEEWPLDGNIFSEDKAADMLHDMAVDRVKGDDASVYLVNAFMWQEGTAPGSVKAYRQQVAWLPASDGGGDGGGKVTFSGTLRAKGAPIHGEAVITKDADTGVESVVFTPNAG